MARNGEGKVDRLDAIRSYLYTNGVSSIQSISDAVGASLATIRRDLNVLERQGAIDRIHGGARIAEGSSVEVEFKERAKRNLAEKRTIAATAYQLLKPHSSVFLDSGTTILQLALLIRINPVPLRIFTNGLAVAQELLNIPQIEVALLGGQLRSENASTVGPQAEAALQSLWFDQLFLGVSAIGTDGAIYSVESAEAALNKCMLSRAAERYLLVDSSKFGSMATYRVAPLTDTEVISDSGLSTRWRSMLSDQGVRVTIARDGAHLPD